MTEKKEIIDKNKKDRQSRDTKKINENVKEFLNGNKIYFETIAVILVAFAALFISYLQLSLSEIQTKLAEAQVKIAKAESSPKFVINAIQVIDEDIGKVTEEKILVKNQGSPVSNFKTITKVFFYVAIDFMPVAGKPLKESKRLEVPVLGYYDANIHKDFGIGTLVSIEGYKNNSKFSALERKLRKLAEAHHAYASLKIRRYLKLKYYNILGDHRIKYFEVPLIFGALPIPEAEGGGIIQRHEKGIISNPDLCNFDTLSAEKLLEAALNQTEPVE